MFVLLLSADGAADCNSNCAKQHLLYYPRVPHRANIILSNVLWLGSQRVLLLRESSRSPPRAQQLYNIYYIVMCCSRRVMFIVNRGAV
jgi:hypothetical protein